MSKKYQNQNEQSEMIEEIKEEVKMPVETQNEAPVQNFKNFDEFFTTYAFKNKVPMQWKASVKKHFEALGVLKDKSKWLESIKHFGA